MRQTIETSRYRACRRCRLLWLAVALVLLAMVLPVAGEEGGAAVEELSLEQALTLALQNNAAVASATLQIQRAEKELEASKTRRLPVLELQATGTQLLSTPEVAFPAGAFGTYPDIGPIPSVDTIVQGEKVPTAWVSASVAQPLTQLHSAGLGIKASTIARDSERQELRLQRAAVANEVRRQYYALLQVRGAAAAARDQVRTLHEMDEEITRHLAQETALLHESLDVKARLAAEEYRLLALDNSFATRKTQLNVLLGRDPGTPFEPAPAATADLEEVDQAAARAKALERPELEQARLQVEAADTLRRLKKAELIPEVSLALTYVSFFNVELLPRSVAQLGLQIKWEPFDWGRRRKELASKTLAVEQASYAARDERNRVMVEVDSAFRKVQEARALVVARRLAHESALEQLRVALLRQKQQAVLLKDVLQAQATAAEARADYDEAELSLWQARADLDKATGEDI
jgi:outer membrane protein TolC